MMDWLSSVASLEITAISIGISVYVGMRIERWRVSRTPKRTPFAGYIDHDPTEVRIRYMRPHEASRHGGC